MRVDHGDMEMNSQRYFNGIARKIFGTRRANNRRNGELHN
jgi:hypothetical protein